jgi:hypothetical protein
VTPGSRSASIRTCCGIRPDSSWPTRAWIPGRYNTTSVTKTSRTWYDIFKLAPERLRDFWACRRSHTDQVLPQTAIYLAERSGGWGDRARGSRKWLPFRFRSCFETDEVIQGKEKRAPQSERGLRTGAPMPRTWEGGPRGVRDNSCTIRSWNFGGVTWITPSRHANMPGVRSPDGRCSVVPSREVA